MVRVTTSSSETDASQPGTSDDRIKQTLSDLDALLGVVEEPEEEIAAQVRRGPEPAPPSCTLCPVIPVGSRRCVLTGPPPPPSRRASSKP